MGVLTFAGCPDFRYFRGLFNMAKALSGDLLGTKIVLTQAIGRDATIGAVEANLEQFKYPGLEGYSGIRSSKLSSNTCKGTVVNNHQVPLFDSVVPTEFMALTCQ